MRLYRSVGDVEFNKLMQELPILGLYNNSLEPQNTDNNDNVICCSATEFKIHDKRHKFDLILEIPEDRILNIYKGTYYVSKETLKTHVWSGRRGNSTLLIPEVVIKGYTIKDVVFVETCMRYADHWFYSNVQPILKKYHIETNDPRMK